MKLSLIIPCFNEADNLPYLFKKIKKFLKNNKYEVILVNNGSQDNTLELIEKFQKQYINLRYVSLKKNKGYGNGIIKGLEAANGEFLSWTHADMQTDPNDIVFAEKYFNLKKNKIFIKGHRYGRSLIDQMFTVGMSIFASLFLKTILWDINAQPTIFHHSLLDYCKNPPDDFSLDLYIYHRAKKLGYEVFRFPVKFNKRLFGISNWNFSLLSKIKFIVRNTKYIINLSRL